ncbi:hypothetical protein EDB81DRAFT_182324 [Dactylonectria macrodidyma]|uniref:Secreted protein n=1 Tax=Dactylonectria macrodidyma TaxID=307937 RepID=A0A9P9FNZ4_9HYPO|nr:hypothetical protein EDB81DRAFT_182324 [Dactylonectria macrodidyma]
MPKPTLALATLKCSSCFRFLLLPWLQLATSFFSLALPSSTNTRSCAPAHRSYLHHSYSLKSVCNHHPFWFAFATITSVTKFD